MPLSLLAFEVWWIAQAAPPSEPTFWLTSLGVFAAAAPVVAFGWRDTIRQRDRAIAAAEACGPALAEQPEVLRANSEALRAASAAMAAMAEALKSRVPSEAEITRMRDALDRAEARRTRGAG